MLQQHNIRKMIKISSLGLLLQVKILNNKELMIGSSQVHNNSSQSHKLILLTLIFNQKKIKKKALNNLHCNNLKGSILAAVIHNNRAVLMISFNFD
jgi:hypothetical protein